jgi:hypothetical protein
MARELQVRLVDDIDGGRAAETVRFSLDGISYEIDLSAKHAKRLRADLDMFVQAGRRVRNITAHRGRVTSRDATDRARNQAIRAWAKRKRIRLAERGRIPRSVIERYDAAGGK